MLEPSYLPGIEPILDAFWALHSDRSVQWLVIGEKARSVKSPIPTSSIILWAMCHSLSDEELYLYRWCIRHADNTYLMWAEESEDSSDYKDEPMSLDRFDRIFG